MGGGKGQEKETKRNKDSYPSGRGRETRQRWEHTEKQTHRWTDKDGNRQAGPAHSKRLPQPHLAGGASQGSGQPASL